MATPTPDITAPITPARFAAALPALPLAALHLKVLELRNALHHLAHSNAQLRPFADGTETSLNLPPGTPDPDCVEAIRENEGVMARMRERIELVKVEVVERRGASWREFEEGVEDDEPGVIAPPAPTVSEAGSRPLTNGVHSGEDASAATNNATTSNTASAGNPWTDGTFQMGTIRNGELHMDTEPPQRPNGAGLASAGTNNTTTTAAAAASSTALPAGGRGGRLTDDELRRLLEVRLAEDAGDDEEDGGLHL